MNSSNTFPGMFSNPDTLVPCSSLKLGKGLGLTSSLRQALAAAPPGSILVGSSQQASLAVPVLQAARSTDSNLRPPLAQFCFFLLLLLPADLSECHFFLPRPQALAHPRPIFTDFMVLCPLIGPTSLPPTSAMARRSCLF